MTVAASEQLNQYLADYETLPGGPGWLAALRGRGMEKFASLGIPTPKIEEWRYTNLAVLGRDDFELAKGSTSDVNVIDEVGLSNEAARAVFVDGAFSPQLSRILDATGVRISSLASVEASELPERQLGSVADAENQGLVALNTAFLRDGAVVEIAKEVVVEHPIHLVFISTASRPNTVSHPRVLVVQGGGSQASVIETYAGIGGETYWTNPVSEIIVGTNAHLEHYKIQLEQLTAVHTSLIQARQDRDSTFTSQSISFGGALVRNDIHSVLTDEGCECVLNGLFAATGQQHVDHHTTIDHAQPHCRSHQLYKGILDGRSRGVFSGKIIVRKDAQKTDAIQNNKNLLLSPEADINTKPQLEIEANDVRCTHGATVGQIDEEATFYLRSRGLSRDAARGILTYAFAADVLGQVGIREISDRFEEKLRTWLGARPRGERGE